MSVLLVAVSCDNGDNNLPKKPVKSRYYIGTMSVDQNDGTFYTQKSVKVDYEITTSGKLNFKMYKVKFADGMPIKLDMTVEGVTCTESNGVYQLSGEGLVPYAMGGPFEKFTITGLVGEITADAMELTFICGEYPVTYSGVKAEGDEVTDGGEAPGEGGDEGGENTGGDDNTDGGEAPGEGGDEGGNDSDNDYNVEDPSVGDEESWKGN